MDYNILEFRKLISDNGFYLLGNADIPAMVHCVLDGYANDYPLNNWFDFGGDGEAFYAGQIPNKTTSVKGWRHVWGANIACQMKEAVAFADSPDINAWMMLLPPHAHQFTDWEWLKSGGLRAFFHLGAGPINRMEKYEQNAVLYRNKWGEEAYYLYNIVVKKSLQNQKTGRKLLDVCHQFCDQFQHDIFLETHKENNVRLYEHFGYELLSSTPIPHTKIPHNVMIRKHKV